MRESEAEKYGDTATAACGGKLAHGGRVDVSVSIGGKIFDMLLSNIETKIPIPSVRRLVRKKKGVMVQEGGGEIVN